MGKMLGEAAVAYYKILISSCLEGLKRTTKASVTSVCIPFDILKGNIQTEVESLTAWVNLLGK